MRQHTASQTAAVVAATRALGAQLPQEAQLALDPYGWLFAYPKLARVLGASGAFGAVTHAWRAVPPLRRWIVYMQVRTRVLDDAVRAFAQAGGGQLVLLGAGYDCRAHRLAGALGAMDVFEIDHPATQRRKRKLLDRHAGALPTKPGVRYLSWDFETQPLSELAGALAALGHRASVPTLTLWEGVTMYLTEEAIEATVAAVRALGGAGSQLVMTYFDRAHVHGRAPWLAKVARSLVARVGEPWRWGWDPAELPGWLAARRLELVQDEPIPQAAARLLPARWAREVEEPLDAAHRVIGYERIALSTLR